MGSDPTTKPSPRRHSEADENRVGLRLVEVLFGLVLAQAFALTLDDYSDISPAGWSHIALTAAVIVLSWVGYYNSRREPVWAMKFFNKPFFQYILDIFIIVSYWALVITAETGSTSRADPARASATPEAMVIAATFFLYVVWDLIEIRIQEDKNYGDRERADGERAMAQVSIAFFVILAALAIVVSWLNPADDWCVAAVNGLYFVALVVYRFLQSRAWQAHASPQGGSEIPGKTNVQQKEN